MKRIKKSGFVYLIVSLSIGFVMISCGGSGDGGSGGGNQPPTYPSSYPNAKIIFVTHTIDNGNLRGWMPECSGRSTGLEAADCICQEHATRWGNLSGTYKAWLSDSTTSASSRLTHFNGPYVNRKGEQIAANWTELTNGTLQCTDKMNYDESGEYMSTQFDLVWTGTDASGNIHPYLKHCNNWTSGAPGYGGMCGGVTAPTSNFGGCWTQWGWRDCDDHNRLYCVEQ